MSTPAPAPGLSLSEFIDVVLLNDLRRMVYDCQLHYLAFGNIAVGIEFLGACNDLEDWHKNGLSTTRFRVGISDYMAKVNVDYLTHNNESSPYYLYKHLRCGPAHVMRPAGGVAFASRGSPDVSGYRHLEPIDGGKQLLMLVEDFYEDFVRACALLKSQLAGKSGPKFNSTFLRIRDLPPKPGTPSP